MDLAWKSGAGGRRRRGAPRHSAMRGSVSNVAASGGGPRAHHLPRHRHAARWIQARAARAAIDVPVARQAHDEERYPDRAGRDLWDDGRCSSVMRKRGFRAGGRGPAAPSSARSKRERRFRSRTSARQATERIAELRIAEVVRGPVRRARLRRRAPASSRRTSGTPSARSAPPAAFSARTHERLRGGRAPDAAAVTAAVVLLRT